MQRVMKDGLFGGGFGGPRCVGRPCPISAFPCSGGFPSGIKREWVEKAGKPYDIDNRTDVPGAPCQQRVIVVLPQGQELARAWSTLKLSAEQYGSWATHGTHRSTLGEQTRHELPQGPAEYQFLSTRGL